jgi:hypothetical protein
MKEAKRPRVRIEELRLSGFRAFENARLPPLSGKANRKKEADEVSYGFRLRTSSRGPGLFIAEEYVFVGNSRTQLIGPASDGEVERNALSLPFLALNAPDFAEDRPLLEVLRTGLLTYKFSPAAIRAEPAIGRAVPLNRDGSNLDDVLIEGDFFEAQ